MSAIRVCDMSCGAMHEFALVLDKAGFNARLVQDIVNSKGNDKAKAMFAVLAKEMTPLVPREKFYFVKALKVTIPQDYIHVTRLTSFMQKYQNAEVQSFSDYSTFLADGKFAKVTTQLVPGKTYTVKIFGINSGELATSDECLAKYREEKAFLVGAQGASFVWEQRREELPKGHRYASFDEKEKLTFAGDACGVPYMSNRSDGNFRFRLVGFFGKWSHDCCLLCFCDEGQPLEPSPLS